MNKCIKNEAIGDGFVFWKMEFRYSKPVWTKTANINKKLKNSEIKILKLSLEKRELRFIQV